MPSPYRRAATLHITVNGYSILGLVMPARHLFATCNACLWGRDARDYTEAVTIFRDHAIADHWQELGLTPQERKDLFERGARRSMNASPPMNLLTLRGASAPLARLPGAEMEMRRARMLLPPPHKWRSR